MQFKSQDEGALIEWMLNNTAVSVVFSWLNSMQSMYMER